MSYFSKPKCPCCKDSSKVFLKFLLFTFVPGIAALHCPQNQSAHVRRTMNIHAYSNSSLSLPFSLPGLPAEFFLHASRHRSASVHSPISRARRPPPGISMGCLNFHVPHNILSQADILLPRNPVLPRPSQFRPAFFADLPKVFPFPFLVGRKSIRLVYSRTDLYKMLVHSGFRDLYSMPWLPRILSPISAPASSSRPSRSYQDGQSVPP